MSKALTAKENTKQEIAYNFTDLIPDYTFTVTGNQIGIRLHTILGADGYEVFRSKTARGKYELIVSSPSPVIEYYTAAAERYPDLPLTDLAEAYSARVYGQKPMRAELALDVWERVTEQLSFPQRVGVLISGITRR